MASVRIHRLLLLLRGVWRGASGIELFMFSEVSDLHDCEDEQSDDEQRPAAWANVTQRALPLCAPCAHDFCSDRVRALHVFVSVDRRSTEPFRHLDVGRIIRRDALPAHHPAYLGIEQRGDTWRPPPPILII